VTVAEEVNAKRERIGERDALALLDGMDHLWSMRGKRVVHVDLRKAKPTKAELIALLLGPTGNLRAPAIRKGRTVIIGFDEATFRRLFR
jgi:arsenate reductase-like glutaredoxin family protein